MLGTVCPHASTCMNRQRKRRRKLALQTSGLGETICTYIPDRYSREALGRKQMGAATGKFVDGEDLLCATVAFLSRLSLAGTAGAQGEVGLVATVVPDGRHLMDLSWS